MTAIVVSHARCQTSIGASSGAERATPALLTRDVQVPERGEGFSEKLLWPGRLREVGLERLCPLAKLFR